MWKFLVCVFLVEVSTAYSARNNGYLRAFRRGYYPGKPDPQDYQTKPDRHDYHVEPTRNYYGYRGHHHHHGYGYPSYPAVYLLGPSYIGHYGFPAYPYNRFGEPDESIYDYKLKVQPKLEPMTIEKLQVDKPDEKANKVKDTMKMKKMMAEMTEMKKQEEQKEMMDKRKKEMKGKETVHAPKYIPLEMPKMVTLEDDKKTSMRPAVRTRVTTSKQESDVMKMKPKEVSSNAELVFNGKFSGNLYNFHYCDLI